MKAKEILSEANKPNPLHSNDFKNFAVYIAKKLGIGDQITYEEYYEGDPYISFYCEDDSYSKVADIKKTIQQGIKDGVLPKDLFMFAGNKINVRADKYDDDDREYEIALNSEYLKQSQTNRREYMRWSETPIEVD